MNPTNFSYHHKHQMPDPRKGTSKIILFYEANPPLFFSKYNIEINDMTQNLPPHKKQLGNWANKHSDLC